MSLGEIQRKSILSASTIKDVMQVYEEVDMLVQKHRESSYRIGSNRIDLQDEFYSKSELGWLTIEVRKLH